MLNAARSMHRSEETGTLPRRSTTRSQANAAAGDACPESMQRSHQRPAARTKEARAPAAVVWRNLLANSTGFSICSRCPALEMTSLEARQWEKERAKRATRAARLARRGRAGRLARLAHGDGRTRCLGSSSSARCAERRDDSTVGAGPSAAPWAGTAAGSGSLSLSLESGSSCKRAAPLAPALPAPAAEERDDALSSMAARCSCSSARALSRESEAPAERPRVGLAPSSSHLAVRASQTRVP
mmetsp:Transcript_16260/g.61646  ORF Transcript_16260/g.61646 Transcript_16260/m.61646 type:complete len:242 (+) Transcript_16260:308-1033(+)